MKTPEDYACDARQAAIDHDWPKHLEEQFMIAWLCRLLIERDREMARWKAVANGEEIQNEIWRGEHDDRA